jgi:hypothetical protein
MKISFKCNECGSEVINITFEEKILTPLISLTYFPDVWYKYLIDNAIQRSRKTFNTIAECDGCGCTWRAENITTLRSLMIQQGVLYENIF